MSHQVSLSSADCYEQAVRRWPQVSWSYEQYASHLASPLPPHPIDVFLAAAAGHRLDAAWTAVEDDIAPQAMDILRRRPTADYTEEDLWCETRTRLMEEDPGGEVLPDGRVVARIHRFQGLVSLRNFTITVALRLAIQRKRRLRPSISFSAGDEDAPIDPPDSSCPEPGVQEREAERLLFQGLAVGYAQLSAEQQFLITMVYRQGMQQQEAGGMLGWEPTKTSKQMRKAIEHLRQCITSRVEWTDHLQAAWEGCWSQFWKNLQVPTDGASESAA